MAVRTVHAATLATFIVCASLAWANEPCVDKATCVVPNAEVDDPETIQARKKAGIGPASGMAADPRMQTDVVQVGTLDNGLKLYSFRYAWDDRTWVGLMVPDLLAHAELKKHVLTLANGLQGIDYAAMGLRLVTLDEWKRSGLAATKADYAEAEPPTTKSRDPIRVFNRNSGK